MSWIKLETHTADKLEIYSMAQELGIEPDAVLGKCFRVWAWFDANTVDGVTNSVTKALLDRQCSVTGFCEAMIHAGWMHEEDGVLQLPYYDRHNSASAKSRALGAKRQAKFKSVTESVTSSVTTSVTEALPESSHREDKRREDKTDRRAPAFNPLPQLASLGVSAQTAADWLALRKAKRAIVTVTALNHIIAEADKALLPLERALSISCKRGWAGFEAKWLKDEDLAGAAPVKDWE